MAKTGARKASKATFKKVALRTPKTMKREGSAERRALTNEVNAITRSGMAPKAQTAEIKQARARYQAATSQTKRAVTRENSSGTAGGRRRIQARAERIGTVGKGKWTRDVLGRFA